MSDILQYCPIGAKVAAVICLSALAAVAWITFLRIRDWVLSVRREMRDAE